MSQTGKIAVVFPGQSRCKPGVGQSLFESYQAVRDALSEANKGLTYPVKHAPLEELLYEGSVDELNSLNAHPLFHALSVGTGNHLIRSLTKRGIKIGCVGGYSLGDWSAATVAEIIKPEKAAALVATRARLLATCEGVQAQVKATPEKVKEILHSVPGWNFSGINTPELVNIAGPKEAIAAALERLSAAKIRARDLGVNISHSPLVQSAADGLRGRLANTQFRAPQIPVLNSALGRIHGWGSYREVLIKQLTSTVLWEESVRTLYAAGFTTFVEVGGITYLASWIKQTCPDSTVFAVTDQDSMEKTLEALAA